MELNGIKYSPQILKQGLLVVLIPFLVLAAVLTMLTFLSKTQETLSKNEQKQSQLLSKCALTFNDWGETVAYLIARAFSDNKTYDEGSSELVAKLRQQFSEIKEQANTGPLADRIDILDRLCMGSIESLEELPRAKALGVMANFETLQRMPPIFHRIYQLPSKVKQTLEEEKKELVQDRKRQDKQAKATLRLAMICICANIVLSLVLIWYFARRITSRLKALTLSASKMSSLEKLNLPLQGKDEIAYLAGVLQDSSEKLIEAAEHRRAIFGMVAHDMRSPLSACQLSLEVIEESLSSNGSQQDLSKLRLAHHKMVGVLSHVNAILTVEKTKTDPEEAPTEDKSAKKSEAASSLLDQVHFWKNPLQYVRNMFQKPNIFHRVLLIVMVPIIFQIIFLGVFDKQIESNRSLLKQQRRLSDISLLMNIIFLDSLKGTVSEAIYAISGEEKLRERALKSFDIAIAEFPPEDYFVGQENEEWQGVLKSWRKLLRNHKNETSVVDSIKRAASTNQLKERLHEIKPLQKNATKIRSKATNLFRQDSLDIRIIQEKQLEAAKTLTISLIVTLIANILVTVILLLAFNRDIRKRLNMLVSNAASVSDPNFAFASVEGTDELAYLNKILWQTQTELRNASSERVSLMRQITTDIQTPLRESILSLNEFSVAIEAELTEKMKRQLQRAKNNIERVLNLVNDLLTMETLETGKVNLSKEECKVRQFAEDAILAVSSLAKQKNIEIENLCTDTSIFADKARLIQTVINYLANAIKFSPENTRIRVSDKPGENSVRICVSDEGPGMDEQTRARVFERFFQAESKEKKQGFGLGLSICTLIVQSHGGILGCDSEPGKGSTFWFEIPAQNSQKN